MAIEGNYSIKKGDTLWAIAKKQLQVGGNEKPTNAQIVNAMNNIAKANGCETPDECAKKFFYKIGNQIQVEGLTVEKTADTPAPTKDKAVLTVRQKTQIDNVRTLAYDSPELKAKLDANKDVNTYAQYFTSNPQYSVKSTINADDGGQVVLYQDADGNIVGSINRDPDGNIRNVALNIADGGQVSLNSNKNGVIESRIAMSKNYQVSEDKDKTSYNKALDLMLSKYDSYQVQKQAGDNPVYNYIVDGKIVVTVVKNAEGEITALHQFNTPVKEGEQQKYFYNDIDGDGVIDLGEGQTRFDREL